MLQHRENIHLRSEVHSADLQGKCPPQPLSTPWSAAGGAVSPRGPLGSIWKCTTKISCEEDPILLKNVPGSEISLLPWTTQKMKSRSLYWHSLYKGRMSFFVVAKNHKDYQFHCVFLGIWESENRLTFTHTFFLSLFCW